MSEYGDAINETFGAVKQQAAGAAAVSIDDDPEKAAKAFQLSDVTGVDPAIVHGDIENFERNTKATFASRLIQNNPHLQDYVNSHSLAPKISNDDWGQLDTVSEKLGHFVDSFITRPQIPEINPDLTAGGTAKNFLKGFQEGVGPEGVGKWFLDQPGGKEFAESYPYSFYAWALIGSPIEVPLRLFTGAIHGTAKAVGKSIGALVDEETGEQVEQAIPAALDIYFAGRMGGAIHPAPGVRSIQLHNNQLKQAAIETSTELLQELEGLVKPWVEQGKPPPVGLHPKIDDIISEQARTDAKALDDAFSESQSSKTRERNPEIFSSFVRQKANTSIGISADAIRELYGEKEPHPEDNILGWVPDIAQRLREAEATGGDVEVPLADWLAKADPAIAKELKDDLRVRASGLTLNEVKEMKEGRAEKEALEPAFEEEETKEIIEKPLEGEIETRQQQLASPEVSPLQRAKLGPMLDRLIKLGASPEEIRTFTPQQAYEFIRDRQVVDGVREAAGLQPLFEEGPLEQLRLKKTGQNEFSGHDFKIMDEKGRTLGSLNLTEQHEGLDLHIDWIGGAAKLLNDKGGVDNVFGPKLMRGLIRQLKTEFPKAEFLSGDRVSGAREQSGKTGQVRIPLKSTTEEHFVDLSNLLKEGEWVDFGLGTKALVPTDKWTENEQPIVDAVNKVLDKVVPKALDREVARSIVANNGKGERSVRGMYTQYRTQLPIILVSLDSANPIGTAWHEALHHLRGYGFLTNDEWQVFKDAAIEGKWIDKHNIKTRYKGQSAATMIEESVAEELKTRNQDKTVPEGAVGKLFQKVFDLFQQIKMAIKDVLGFEPTVEDLFKKVESGEVGAREGTGPIDKRAFQSKAEEQPELPGMTRQEDLEVFDKANALGITADQYKRYMKLIDKRNAEDLEEQTSQAKKEASRKLTKDWRENAARVRQQVLNDIDARPDISVGNFFRDGVLYGEPLEGKPKLDVKSLTEEEKKGLPRGTYGPGGIHPSDAAELFGYHSGTEMVNDLIQLEKARGELPMKDYLAQLVEQEVQRRMERRHGKLADNILAEAQEHVLSPTQMDLLHEETVALGMQAGHAQMPFSKDDIKGWIKDEFGTMPISKAKADKFLASAGRAGRKLETALLKDEAQDAFKLAQQRQFAALLAKEAGKFEKEVDKDLRLVGRYADKANIKAVAQEYTDQIHSLLQQFGFEIKRAQANLVGSLEGKSLDNFIAERNAAGDGILKPNLPAKTSLMDFTVDEYRDFMATVKSLDFNGRKAKTIEIGNREGDHERVIERIGANLGDLEKKNFDPTKPGGLALQRKIIREVDARLVKAEQLADWIDKNNVNGPFNQTVVRPLFKAQHERGDMIAKLAQMVKGIPVDRAWGRALSDVIEHRFFRDEDGSFTRLTRENMIAMALNWGNRSNRSVLARGKGWSEGYIQTFLDTHMTKMDWDFVQGIWSVFDKMVPLLEEATLKRYGVPIKMVDAIDVQSPHGKMPGGYYPLIKDPRAVLLGDQIQTDLVDKPLFDPLPMARAMHERIGTAYPLDLSLNNLSSRINETLHAALFQDPIRNARKVIGTKAVRTGIDKAFGPEYVNQLDKWLKDIANNGGENSDAQASWISRNARENVVFGLMGYKVSTAAIHAMSAGAASVYEVGPTALAKNIKDLGIAQALPDVARRFFANEKQMWSTVDWAQETFPELRNRMQDIGRDMQAQLSGIVSKGFLDDAAKVRSVNIVWSMKMVATLDQLTATPVAIAAYKKALADGMSHEDAVFAGDKAVRQAHGSASLVGRANIGRGEVMKWLTVAYNGYWNHNFNRTRSAVRDIKAPDLDFSQRLIIGSSALAALVIAPALIHYSIRGSENDTVAGAMAEALVSQFGGQVPLVNTMTYAFMHNRDPHVSPVDEILSKAVALKKDVSQLANGHKADALLKHILEAPGFFLGLGASNQIATAIQFNKDVYSSKERPKSILEWARGEITGHAQPPKRQRR